MYIYIFFTVENLPSSNSTLLCPFDKQALVISAGIMYGIHGAGAISRESLSLHSLTLSTAALHPLPGQRAAMEHFNLRLALASRASARCLLMRRSTG